MTIHEANTDENLKIHDKEKNGKSNSINPETPTQKVYYNKPFAMEREISPVYPVIDTDLARDNLENDLSSADLQDL